MCCLKLSAFLPYILYLTTFTFFERAECRVPSAGFRGLGIWYLEPGTFCLVLSAWCYVRSAECRVLSVGTWNLEPGTIHIPYSLQLIPCSYP